MIEVKFISKHTKGFLSINISDPDEDFEALVNPDEVVIPMKTIKIIYDYPLDDTSIFETYEADTSEGFTCLFLVKKIVEGYKQIYETEKEATGSSKIPSKGSYGLYTEIDSLLLQSVKQMRNDVFVLGIDT